MDGILKLREKVSRQETFARREQAAADMEARYA